MRASFHHTTALTALTALTAVTAVTALASVLALATAALAATPLVATPLAAQRDAEDWLERCRAGRSDSRSRDRDNDDRRREKYCEVRRSGMRPTGRSIVVDARENGGIAVRGWDRDSIAIEVRIQTHAGSQSEARELADRIRVETSGDAIHAEGPSSERDASWSVSYEIMVPRRSSLTLDTHNGPLAVEAVSGTMELRAHNGPLALSDVGGDVRARTTNGPLSIDLGGSRWEGRGLDAETTNGPVTLSLPENYSAQLETGTVNGPMRVGFPITIQGRLTQRIRTELGSGGPPVRAVTTNGPAVITRRQ